MYKCTEAGHRQIQHMAENQDHDAEHPIHYRNRNIQNHRSHDVESISEHTAGKTERIKTDVAQYISEEACNHVIGIPEAGSDVHQRIASRCIEHENRKTADSSKCNDYPLERLCGKDFRHAQ